METGLATELDEDGDDALALQRIADDLEAEGVEVTELRELSEEIALIERPPGLLLRMTHKARKVAVTQWRHFLGELQESREAMTLIMTKVRGDRDLTDEERDKVRDQLMDLVRIFPAGVIAAANTALPVPGTSVFTPWLLVRLGLMPSRWREAHLLHELRRQREILSRTGHAAEAERIALILDHLEAEADERDSIRREARLLTHWDANRNGVWDPEEREAYSQAVDKIGEKVRVHAARKRWFLEYEGEVYGAIRLTELDLSEPGELLVCFDGTTGWVALADVLE